MAGAKRFRTLTGRGRALLACGVVLVLAGVLLGHVVALGLRLRSWVLPAGAVVWVAAVAGGMLLRRATGDGTDPAFVVVATLTLGVFLLGWRLVIRIGGRRRTPSAPRARPRRRAAVRQ
mgnify:CR=1 FL=1